MKKRSGGLRSLTQDPDLGLAEETPGVRLGLAAVHVAVVHLHVVDPQGAVGEQLEAPVLQGEREREREREGGREGERESVRV